MGEKWTPHHEENGKKCALEGSCSSVWRTKLPFLTLRQRFLSMEQEEE